jgi:hypothetical protein
MNSRRRIRGIGSAILFELVFECTSRLSLHSLRQLGRRALVRSLGEHAGRRRARERERERHPVTSWQPLDSRNKADSAAPPSCSHLVDLALAPISRLFQHSNSFEFTRRSLALFRSLSLSLSRFIASLVFGCSLQQQPNKRHNKSPPNASLSRPRPQPSATVTRTTVLSSVAQHCFLSFLRIRPSTTLINSFSSILGFCSLTITSQSTRSLSLTSHKSRLNFAIIISS